MTHSPTSTGAPHHIPTVCFCCGRRAFGVGFGDFKSDPLFLCELCLPLLHQIKSARSFDVFENQAIDDAIDGVGGLIERYGTDLGEWDESQRRQFVMEIILGFGDSIRAQVRDKSVPF